MTTYTITYYDQRQTVGDITLHTTTMAATTEGAAWLAFIAEPANRYFRVTEVTA